MVAWGVVYFIEACTLFVRVLILFLYARVCVSACRLFFPSSCLFLFCVVFVVQVTGVMWEKLPSSPIVESSKEGFAGIKAFVELKTSKHVVEVEVSGEQRTGARVLFPRRT